MYPSSHSFKLFLPLATLFLISDVVHSKAISASVFPNSACAGNANALVGIGHVVLASGEIETHCGCPADNLPKFVPCPSSTTIGSEAVCNSQLDLSTGTFTAFCSIIACVESECPTTVVNTVVLDDDECSASGQGILGFSTYDGEAKCSCSAGEADFTVCPSPQNGRGACISTDSDFLGAVPVMESEAIKCDVVCDQGYFSTPGGSCIRLEKRNNVGPSPTTSGPSATHTTTTHGPSKPYNAFDSPPTPTLAAEIWWVENIWTPATEWMPIATSRVVHPTGTLTTTSRPIHTPGVWINGGVLLVQGQATPDIHSFVTSRPTYRATATVESDAAQIIAMASVTLAPIPGPSASARARLRARSHSPLIVAQEVIQHMDPCSAEERSCASGFGVLCVRYDDVTQCGGCSTSKTSQNCLTLPGVLSAKCLSSGCAVQSCQPGFTQTGENVCSAKA